MDKFYHYEDIAKWWLDNQITEVKLKRLFPGIDVSRLRIHASHWSYDKMYPNNDGNRWDGFLNEYDSPIELAEWILHPENDSYGCRWFRENLYKPEIKQEIVMNASHNIMEELDMEVFERFEHLSDIWGGTGGFWITQVAFYAARLDGGDDDMHDNYHRAA